MRKPTLKEDKLYCFDSDNKVYCKCGQYGVVFYNTGRDKLICKNCGNYIYKDKKTELKYMMKEKGVCINGNNKGIKI